MNPPTLKKEEFLTISKLIEANAGIHLPENEKNYSLISSRLAKILRSRKLDSYQELINSLQSKEVTPKEWSEFISSLTTNTTSFFREEAHFDILKSYLKEMNRQGKLKPELRLWCSASSTGMEVYTILMVVLETLQEIGRKVELKFLASDIDLQCLQKSAQGLYREEDVTGVSNYLRTKYFDRISKGGQRFYQVKGLYRNMIKFSRVNLIQFPYPFQHRFDFIFCRNVLIYFTRAKCHMVTTAMGECLNSGGLLILGHSETGMIDKNKFDNYQSSTYIPRRGKAA